MCKYSLTSESNIPNFQLNFVLQDIPAGQIHEFQVHRPGEKPQLYELKLGDEVMQAPMVNLCSEPSRGDITSRGNTTSRNIRHAKNSRGISVYAFQLQAMFYPQLFGIVGEILVSTPNLQYDDPEDLLDDKQLLEVVGVQNIYTSKMGFKRLLQ